MKKKVLITGANGFVGVHLVRVFLENDYEVYSAVRSTSSVSRLEKLSSHIVRVDYSSSASIVKSVGESGPYDYVVHNAGVTEAIDMEAYRKGNVELTGRLLEALDYGDLLKGNFVYVSSLAARGPGYKGKDDPISDYGNSKYEAEQVVKKGKLPYVMIRPTAVYGSGDAAFLELVKMVKSGLGLSIGSKSAKLTFIHGSDLAELIFEVKDLHGKTFYGHDGGVYSQKELVDTIKACLAKKFVLPIHLPTGLVKAVSSTVSWVYNKILRKSWHYNPPKIRELTATDWTIHDHPDQKLLNFAPKYSLDEGFAEAIDFYKKENWL